MHVVGRCLLAYSRSKESATEKLHAADGNPDYWWNYSGFPSALGIALYEIVY
jgi:hypothetical protein